MNELEKNLSVIIDKTMMDGKDCQRQILKSQILKMACRLQTLDAASMKEFMEVLESMNWRNYLTESEAKEIVSLMNPKPAWPTYEVWKNRMDDADYEYSEQGIYNGYALFVVMNMVYSDSANSICMVAGRNLKEIPEEEMFAFVYLFALDKLKDEDGRFQVRRYFLVDQ